MLVANSGGNPKNALTNNTGMVRAGRSNNLVNQDPAARSGPPTARIRSRTTDTGRAPRAARFRFRCSDAAPTHSRTRSDRNTPRAPRKMTVFPTVCPAAAVNPTPTGQHPVTATTPTTYGSTGVTGKNADTNALANVETYTAIMHHPSLSRGWDAARSCTGNLIGPLQFPDSPRLSIAAL